ncbi:MAG TPA: sugar ABC transporter permease [Anaerolineaceae bacterium]|nr:sugar ABC transporter permease [Anaerolineaceae bacterium]HPN53611.1 sugar ABC transporter permease [Anaerolineaceae bacterium]
MTSFNKTLQQAWKGRNGYLFILPPLLSLVIFFFYPFLRAIYLSFTDYDGTNMKWVGLDNYIHLLQEENFQKAAVNTLAFTVESLVVGVGIALISALVIHHISTGKGFFRGVFFLPVVTNMVAVSMLWKMLYLKRGLINGVLGMLGIAPISFLGSPQNAMFAIVITSAWQGFGYSMVMFLAALEGIPKEFYEAADIDGANFFQKFWFITIPELRYTFLFLSITGVSGAVMVFTQIYVMTAGGPLKSTGTVMFDLFDRFIHLRLGEANAIGVIIFLFLLVFSLINLRISRERDS